MQHEIVLFCSEEPEYDKSTCPILCLYDLLLL
jgi:hypothetical protein